MDVTIFKKYFSNTIWHLKHNAIWNFDSLPGLIWWKARKDFKRPKIKFHIIDNNNYVSDYLVPSRGFLIVEDLYWKTKWGTYRFEWLPHITIRAFGKCFVWTFESPNGDNSTYYETIMDYLWRYDKDIKKTKENFGWKKQNDKGEWVSCWDDSVIKYGN